MFAIPEGMAGYSYPEVAEEFSAPDTSIDGNSAEIDILYEDDTEESGDGTDDSGAPDTPDLEIVDQIVRISQTGNQVVDVIVEVEDVVGASKYEFRVVKV